MEKLPEFLMNHWILSSSFMVIYCILLYDLINDRLSGIQRLGALEAVKLMSHEDAVVVDVREDHEFAKGYIADALHIPLSKLQDSANSLLKDKSKRLLLYCESGNRSLTGGGKLKKLGYKSLYSMQGGIIAWKNANLPIAKKTKKKKS